MKNEDRDKAESEVRTAKLIVGAMRQDFDALDSRLAPSKRGSYINRLMDSLGSRIKTTELCLDDAIKALGGEP